MGVDAVLVLDEVGDVDRILGEMTIPDPSVRYQRIVDALRGLVSAVRLDSFYNPEDPKPDRVFVDLLARYWYPGESHYSPGNWRMVSRVCRFVWAIDPSIVVHYIPEQDWIGDMTANEVIEDAHVLTPARLVELDIECDHAEREMERRRSSGESSSGFSES